MQSEETIPIEKKQYIRPFLRQYHVSVTLVTCAIAIAMLGIWITMPAPYSLRYLFNRATKNPTFECKDGVYSFAVTTQGTCSGHGGIARRMPPN